MPEAAILPADTSPTPLETLEAENDRHDARELTWYYDDDDSFMFKVRLTPEQGARVVKALKAATEAADGTTLDVGRRTRGIPPALRRALERRDGGCRFPGCTAHHYVDAHHIHPWSDGGETKLDNYGERMDDAHAIDGMIQLE